MEGCIVQQDGSLEALVWQAEAQHRLPREAITALLAAPEAEENLAAAADRVRRAFVGDGVHLRGLIEFSNICRQDCMYCGLRRENGKVKRYRLSADAIVELARKAKGYGYQTVVLQSGEDMYFTAERLAAIVRRIKALDLAVTLSVGERSYEEYALWRAAGADRYLLRIETTDEAVYERWDPDMAYANRIRCLRDLHALGYEVGTGTLVGLPGQSLASLADDILFYQQIDADMVGIGPLIPNPDTPLGTAAPGDFHLTRRMVSLLRLLLPEANIPATTAMETMMPHGRELILASGANVVMPNVTEGDPRRNYALYPGKVCVADTPAACRSCMSGRIRAMGRFVAKDKGFRQHRQHGG
ncbi:[FeFe] hydrogenase H-cluster radical SAM maturase HydE [Mitsuokella multacida]|jgi:biotin synthase|uniref:[FeFe] hydrogenase H-cluster radical SAM maturase HydE n=1 Tax=Mitsuokella multacida TaxID=52226 RepID=UPI0022E6AD9C|nr:[FeFe] hydrogenase H-cluster radical SAM maturase HydE [Mitsuokella multacida]